ncbi:MAG: isoprenylcysteine carboxylmethyltransferase family protein [Chloroflexota bacterium]
MKSLIFSLGTLLLVFISRASLRQPRSHGFYRFFAWEAILALFLLNADFWFRDTFAPHQLIAWTLLFASFIPFGFGVHSLRTRGKQTAHREDDASLYAFEKTTQLITTGIYRYIRHPLYSSLLLLAWGIFFKHVSWAGIILVSIASGFLILTARADEKECVQFFGAEYQEYMRKTKRYIPFLF